MEIMKQYVFLLITPFQEQAMVFIWNNKPGNDPAPIRRQPRRRQVKQMLRMLVWHTTTEHLQLIQNNQHSKQPGFKIASIQNSQDLNI